MSVSTLRPSRLPLHNIRTRHLGLPSATRPLVFPLRGLRGFSDAPDVLSAHRTLPYPTLPIYDIITSINSYPDFIPFCTSARITAYSNPDKHFHRKWPQRASLTIGYGHQINESFVSRVYCVPPVLEKGRAGVGFVEAISGNAQHSLDPAMLAHHTDIRSRSDNEALTGPLEFLRTRWTVKNYPFKPAPEDGTPPQEGKVEPDPQARQMTDVGLSLEYRFSNPLYEMMSKAVAGKIAEKMIEAFVKRVEDVLQNSHHAPQHTQARRFEQ